MGSGIAAHCANAGIPVVLLDIVPPNGPQTGPGRNAFAAGALEKLKKIKPAAFMHPRNAALVSIGNFDDDLGRVAEADLIIEAIVEKLDTKRALFAKLETLAAPHAPIASNTSGLRIADMLEGRSAAFRSKFLVTHFFNPPRYMKLLELVAGPETSPEAKAVGEAFGEQPFRACRPRSGRVRAGVPRTGQVADGQDHGGDHRRPEQHHQHGHQDPATGAHAAPAPAVIHHGRVPFA